MVRLIGMRWHGDQHAAHTLPFYHFICVRGTSLVSIVLLSIVLNRQPFQERPRSSDGVCRDRLHPLHDLVLYKRWLVFTFLNVDLLVFHFGFPTSFMGTTQNKKKNSI